ncbi:S9 family peptidase [Flavobacteriaceae bacterium GSB9]|nr:S9 family peptidase [Flavobacteriaceae bacterium GSB9]
MNHLKFSFCVCLFLTSILSAQTKEITLEDIWKYGTFSTKRMNALHSMANGKQYSVLEVDRATRSTQVNVYDYKTLNKVKTVVSSANLEAIPYFTDYTFSVDEQKLLLATNLESIYRWSKKGIYFVYDIKNGALTILDSAKIQQPTFSPDGNKIAFAKENNLFVKNLDSGEVTQITFDGKKNEIINGIGDWVYQEEFSESPLSFKKPFTFVRAFDWNADSNKIAFIRFDERQVPEFSMDIYGQDLYPTQQVFKYPKAGEANSKVSLHIYNLENNKTHNVEVDKTYDEFYIPRMKWTKDSNILSAQYMNRRQNELDLWFINAKTNTSKLVQAETDDAYVELSSSLTFLKDNSFIWTSEKDGFNHIYYYDNDGNLVNQVTKGDWEVTNYYGFDEESKTIFYQSTENGSINRDVYSIKLNGKHKKRLTKSTGTNNAVFNADFSYFINTYSSAKNPPQYTLNSAESGNVIKSIIDNDQLAKKLADYKTSEKEFSTININGNDLNMWMIKPADFDENKQYPLFMYQYSGPDSQEVKNQWNESNDYWFQFLAQKGYIIVCVDGRGTGYKGAEFKKVSQNQLGKYEVEDQISAAKKLGDLPFIDKTRIGIWGWSYGGYMSSNALFQGNDVFKMAIAVAPVSSWRFYDSVYAERFMSTPQENPSGYDDNSPINHVDKLKGDFLLVHGSGDDNVHVQNTMRLAEALIQADKQFEWAIYPDKNHGIYGGNTRLHLYKKMTNFVDETLGDKIQKEDSKEIEKSRN